MALNTEMTFARLAVVDLFVKVMLLAVIDFRPMALGTEVVLFLVAFETVDIMTVAAAYAVLVHFALHKRTVDIDLFQNLAVRVIEPFSQELRHHHIQQVTFGM
jgi:hypothetical protein